MILIQAFIVQDPIVDISLCVNQVTLHEETASVLHGCLVAKTPDDSVIVVSMRKVSKRNIEFVDGCESCVNQSNCSLSVRMDRSTHPLPLDS